MAEEKNDGLNPEILLKKLKQNLARKLMAGEVPVSELERLAGLEKKLERQKKPDNQSEDGIPERLKIKRRPYTLSGKALEQRRAASRKMQDEGLSTGPRTDEGKAISSRNAWKHS